MSDEMLLFSVNIDVAEGNEEKDEIQSVRSIRFNEFLFLYLCVFIDFLLHFSGT